MADGAFAIAREQPRGLARFPSTAGRKPSRRREMMQHHHRLEAVLLASREHAPVMLELRERKLTRRGFDARPFNREAVGVEAQRGEQRHVVGVAMVVITGVT